MMLGRSVEKRSEHMNLERHINNAHDKRITVSIGQGTTPMSTLQRTKLVSDHHYTHPSQKPRKYTVYSARCVSNYVDSHAHELL